MNSLETPVSARMGLPRCVMLQAPFRFPRIILFGGLGIGAAVGLFIISFRLVAALKGASVWLTSAD